MYYIKSPLSFRQVEHLLTDGGIDIFHETVRFWIVDLAQNLRREFARKGWVYSNWQWYFDEVFVKINEE